MRLNLPFRRIWRYLALTWIVLAMFTPPTFTQSDTPTGGVGLGLKATDEGRILIEFVAPGGPGERAGLRVGDQLVRVGERSVADLGGSQLVDAIRGPVGSKVVLTYLRAGGAPQSATVLRAPLGSRGPVVPESATPPPLPLPLPSGAAGKPTSPGAPGKKSGSLRFTQQSLRDPAAQNVVAVNFLLPQGWKYQGQIVWLPNYSVLANLRLRLEDTNSATAIDWLPTQHFSYTDQLPGLVQPGANWMGAILAAPITDPAQFVEAFWGPQTLSHLRNLRPSAQEEFPGIAREAVAQNPGWHARAFRLRYTFDQAGRPWEQDVYFTLAYAPVNAGIAMWNVQRAFTCSGPRGTLDASVGLLKAVISNTSFSGEWLATYGVVQQLRRQGLQQQMADTAAFGQQLQQYNAHIQRLGQQMHEERMKSFDRIAESQREYLGGVETYTDPYQRMGIYVPAGYREHWVNEKGEILLADQVGFNPNVGDVHDWRKMERRDPMKQ